MALNLGLLNTRQLEAVEHHLGPLLILAGAGSGKTSTMAYRIAYLIIVRHIPASCILGLSFTNKAAAELKTRVMQLLGSISGKTATRGLTITTFHSLCVRILRTHSEFLGFQNSFTILDQNDQLDVMKQVLKNTRIQEGSFKPEFILFEISHAKNQFINVQESEAFFLRKMSDQDAFILKSCYQAYQDQLRVLNALDFDDLIYCTVELLEKYPDVCNHWNHRFRHILVDEYQDTNKAQFKIIKLLTQKQQNICVVGDDDQSIYSWRGGDPSHILGFSNDYPQSKIIALEQNYRSTHFILEAANAVIEKNKNRYPKKLWSGRGQGEMLTLVVVEDDRDEVDYVIDAIKEKALQQHRPWSDFAILYRSNSQSRVFEESLRRNKIPYKIVGGLSFLERKEVKDILAYWRVITNSKDDASLRRVINWPSRGIGKSTIECLGGFAFASQVSFFDALSQASHLAPKTAPVVRDFEKLITDLRKTLEQIPGDASLVSAWANDSLKKIHAKKAIEEESEDPVQAARKWENVEELVHSIGQYKGDEPTQNGVQLLRDYLTGMLLQAHETQKEELQKENQKETLKKNQITLLTLHGSKGLEYSIVFLVGMEEGLLPHKRTLEESSDLSEERRLCYVGMTRAKDALYLLRTKNRIRYGKAVPRSPSRFLDEIPKQQIRILDRSLSPNPLNKDLAHEIKVKGFLDQIRSNLMKK